MPSTPDNPVEYPLVYPDAEGIFHIDYGSCTKLTLKHAMKAMTTGGEPVPGTKFAVLTHAPCILEIEEGVKELFFSDELGQRTAACAILLNKEGFNDRVGELYLFFGEPPYPVELFSDENEALDWLRTFM